MEQQQTLGDLTTRRDAIARQLAPLHRLDIIQSQRQKLERELAELDEQVQALEAEDEAAAQERRQCEEREQLKQMIAEWPRKCREQAQRIAEYKEMRSRLLRLVGDMNGEAVALSRMWSDLWRLAQKHQVNVDDLPNGPGYQWVDEMRIDTERHLVNAKPLAK